MNTDGLHDFGENQKLNLLQDISLTLAKVNSMEFAFEEVLGHICRFMGWPLGHIYVWSETADALVSSRVWYMADASTIAPFRLLSEKTHFKKGEGTLGRVWESGEAIFILDVREQTVFVRQMPIETGGIRAYFAFPIMIGEEVAAVLEFFSPVSAAPDQDITSLINHVSILLALAMERQRTLIDLKQSKARLDEAQRTAHVGHWEWDIAKNEVSWSPELYRIYGLTQKGFGANYEDYLERIHPDDLAFVMKKVGDAHEEGKAYDYFHRIVRPDGEERVLNARGRPVFDEAGTIIKLIGTFQDVTEQKETEEKLAQSNRQLQRRLDESVAILAISNAITEVYNLDELLHLIAEKAQDIIAHADWTTIHLLHAETKQLELAASAGLEISPNDYLINSGEGIAGLVIAEGVVINVPDLQTDGRRLPIDLLTHARSLVSAPVETQRERIGTIMVQCATPDIFTEDDKRLLTIFGVQAGMAIENVRLYQVQQRAREKAEKQKRRMQQMARRVVMAQEKERDRIARELHDESGQSLTSLKISLDLIRSMLPEEMTEVRQKMADILSLTDKTMTNLRLLSHNLRPPGLDAYGLDAALAGLCLDFANHTSLRVDYVGIELADLAPLTALSLYQFVQEALTNTAKHAKASEIEVTLSQNSDMIALTVKDNGQGFTPPDLAETVPAQGAGLLGMIERLEIVDGNLSIESASGRGSVLTAVVPYEREGK